MAGGMRPMILIDAAHRSQKTFDACLHLAEQMAARGHKVVMDERSLPDDADRNRKYAAARFLAELAGVEFSHVVLIGAEEVSAEVLIGLRGVNLAPGGVVCALGHFGDHQAHVSARARLANALGHEPVMVDLADLQAKPLASMALFADTKAAPASLPGHPARLTVIPDPATLSEPETLARLAALDHRRDIRLRVIVSSEHLEHIRATKFHALPVYAVSELSPMTFAAGADIAAFFGQGVPGDAMAAMAVCLMAAGGVVIDGTDDQAFLSAGAPALRGPPDLAALGAYLDEVVMVNLAQISEKVSQSPWQLGISFTRLEAALGLPSPSPSLGPAPELTDHRPKTVFLPTNGVGLGHAQRCTVIAAAMGAGANRSFAAFPSCVPMINAKGFDCLPLVQKSEGHLEPFANDLVNYLRLSQHLAPGDRLVFDGGYVFDSIFRTIIEKQLSAVWVRRGLWPQGAAVSNGLERERIFDRVIVPSEPFAELNDAYSFGSHIHAVGPIVQVLPQSPDGKARVRSRLAERFGCDFDELVVSMLGGGVASDRSAQLQGLCSLLERRKSCLHLVVVWPGSTVLPTLHLCNNTRVVQTTEALALAQAADLVVSAAGYNSLNEVLYHGIPAIFIPQSAPYLDDQTRRARAASDRGLSVTVLAQELLRLEREVLACLDGGKAALLRARLKLAELPSPGTDAAARLIEMEAGR
jgi:hypothetical protein